MKQKNIEFEQWYLTLPKRLEKMTFNEYKKFHEDIKDFIISIFIINQ